jgi:hypothetical protein
VVDRIAREVFGLVVETRGEGVLVVARATRQIVLRRDIDSLIGGLLAERVLAALPEKLEHIFTKAQP